MFSCKGESYVQQFEFKLESQEFKNWISFLNAAYKDYIAARILINNGELYNGVILANTAIEKYLKVFIMLHGKKKKTHSTKDLLKQMKNIDSQFASQINIEFIELLSMSYKMRYLEDILLYTSHIFAVTIPRRKLLAELDYTVYILENCWKYENDNNGGYMLDLKKKKKALFDNNYILNGWDKTMFIEHPTEKELFYELQGNKDMGIIEIIDTKRDVKNDGKFLNQHYQINFGEN